jgi:hypothetical protein
MGLCPKADADIVAGVLSVADDFLGSSAPADFCIEIW